MSLRSVMVNRPNGRTRENSSHAPDDGAATHPASLSPVAAAAISLDPEQWLRGGLNGSLTRIEPNPYAFARRPKIAMSVAEKAVQEMRV